MFSKTLVYFLCIFVTFSSLHAELILKEDKQTYERFFIKYYYDESSSLEIEDIERIDFNQSMLSQFTQGYKKGNAWFKIELVNKSEEEDFILVFTESIWSSLDVYTKDNTTWRVQKNGLNIPLKERNIQDIYPAFHLHIPSNEKALVYVKGNTIAGQIGSFQVYTKDEYFNPNRITMTEWYIIYAFVLSIFIVLNLYNFLITKEGIYAYYIGYLFIYIVFSTMHSGIYTLLGFENWQEGLHVVGQLTLFGLLQFSKEFLNLKFTYALMKKVFNYMSVIALIFAVLISQNVPYATLGSNLYFSFSLLLMIYVAINVLNHGYMGAKYYLVALLLYLPTMAMMAMDFNTVLDNTNINRYAFLAGSFVEMLLFTLILTNRYLVVKEEVIEKTEKLHALNENLHHDIQEQLAVIREKDGLLLEQAKLASMGEMIGNIAHQWRQPLNALGLILQKITALHNRNKLDEQALNTSMEKGMRLIDQMSKTIDDFRYLYKENKQAQTFQLLNSIENCHSLVSAALEAQNVKLEIDVSESLIVYNHENELLQVLLNIVNNARDALLENSVKDGLIHISAKRLDKNIIIDIQDNAGGIQPDIINKVFEPYFTTKDEGKGTGIGLFMSKRIVEEKMHGKLSVSNTSTGAKFTIILQETCAL